jgi:hypothetical protein
MASIDMFDLVGGFSGVSTTSNHTTVDRTCPVKNCDLLERKTRKQMWRIGNS